MRTFVLSLSAMAVLSACGSDDSVTVETEDGDTVAYSSASSDDGSTTATITTDEGTATMRTGADAKVDLPLGFKLYPGAQVVSSTTFDQAGERGALLTFVSDASPDELIAFYRKAAEGADISIEMSLTTDNSKIIGGKGAGERTFSFSTVPGPDGKTQGQLMIGTGG